MLHVGNHFLYEGLSGDLLVIKSLGFGVLPKPMAENGRSTNIFRATSANNWRS